jgi:hypothetical protein
MTTVVTAANAADFLAVVPHLVGFQPQDSIVFVAFRGRRTCGAMRFDLPDVVESGADDAGSAFYERVATTLVGMLSKLPGVDSVVPVVYTLETFAAAGGPPRSAFVRAVVARFEFSGFELRDALCVAADGWGSYFDDKRPSQGRPLAEVAASRVLDDLPEHKVRPLGDIARWAALPEVAPAECRRVARAVTQLRRSIDGRLLTGGGDDGFGGAGPIDGAAKQQRRAETRRLHDIPVVLEETLNRGCDGLDANSAAFVVTLARLPALRDVVMLQWAFDLRVGQSVLADARRFARGAAPFDLETAGLMLGRGTRPDPERIDRAVEVLKRVTALSPLENRAPLFSMLAWLSWALGRSSVARLFVEAAEEIDAGYGFADLMRTVLERGMLPEWAFEGDA